MQMFVKILTFISMLAVICTILMLIVVVITFIIGLVKKDYKYFKRSLKILLWPVGAFIVTILLYATFRAISQ